MIKQEDIHDDMIEAIKELHLENDQLRNRLDNVITTLRELQNEHIALAKRVKLLYDDDFRD
jgi:regulator of replication initiation timing